MLTVPTWSAGHTATDLHLAASSLLEVDILTTAPTPAQLTPERRLWLAVIADAIECLRFRRDKRGWQAKEFLLSRRFRDICDNLGSELGWDATLIQARVAHLEMHPPVMNFRMTEMNHRRVVGKVVKRRRRIYTGPVGVASRTGTH